MGISYDFSPVQDRRFCPRVITIGVQADNQRVQVSESFWIVGKGFLLKAATK